MTFGRNILYIIRLLVYGISERKSIRPTPYTVWA